MGILLFRLRVIVGFTMLLVAGTVASQAPKRAQSTPRPAADAQFTDVTAVAGIRFTHNTGEFGKKYLPETMGAGCAFIDFDGDGWQDIFLVNGSDWPERFRRRSLPALYRNNRNGTFSDVTQQAGLAVEMYGMGAAVGDYDNDGRDDLFVTARGQSRLFRNNGNGTFSDVTRKAGLGGISEFSSSAAWLDYDRDGRLDLFVANYVQWSPQTDIFCTLDGRSKSYCTPESYKGVSARLWRNRGQGTFQDVTAAAGLQDATNKSLGIAVLDFNQDGLPDVLLANDTQPNKLYVNQGNGKFLERGVLAGVAFSEDGVARAGMGVDAADYDGSGYPHILISNFSNQMLSLYHNEGNGLFVDEAARSQVGRASLLTLGFGCFFFDYDLDGWLDIFVANGHIENEIERIQGRVKYAEPPHLFRNTGASSAASGRFAEVTAQLGRAFSTPRVARGAAYADIDNDGDLDLLITTNGGPPTLFRNDAAAGKSLRLRLQGVRSNRNGIGAVVRITDGSHTQWQMLRSGSSYLSQSELVLTFGLGTSSIAGTVEVRWPSGQVDRIAKISAGRTITLQEGKGPIAEAPFASKQAFPERAQKP